MLSFLHSNTAQPFYYSPRAQLGRIETRANLRDEEKLQRTHFPCLRNLMPRSRHVADLAREAVWSMRQGSWTNHDAQGSRQQLGHSLVIGNSILSCKAHSSYKPFPRLYNPDCPLQTMCLESRSSWPNSHQIAPWLGR